MDNCYSGLLLAFTMSCPSPLLIFFTLLLESSVCILACSKLKKTIKQKKHQSYKTILFHGQWSNGYTLEVAKHLRSCVMKSLHFLCAWEPLACIHNSLANQEAIIFVNCAQR